MSRIAARGDDDESVFAWHLEANEQLFGSNSPRVLPELRFLSPRPALLCELLVEKGTQPSTMNDFHLLLAGEFNPPEVRVHAACKAFSQKQGAAAAFIEMQAHVRRHRLI